MWNSLSAGANDAKSWCIGDPERCILMVRFMKLKKLETGVGGHILVLGITYIIAIV
jgi:hypothetical protein